jgi:uncharacterized protein YuzE
VVACGSQSDCVAEESRNAFFRQEAEMKLTVHKEYDALYLRLDDSEIVDSEEVEEGIVLDYNRNGKVVGIEILHLSRRSPDSLEHILLESA